MRQGRASSSRIGSTKVEPTPHAVNLTAVERMGEMIGNHATDNGGTVNVKSAPLYSGRGLKAPMVGTTSHKAGSQGRY